MIQINKILKNCQKINNPLLGHSEVQHLKNKIFIKHNNMDQPLQEMIRWDHLFWVKEVMLLYKPMKNIEKLFVILNIGIKLFRL